jgi:glycosyltransferase involved in cell wall biosynthesis
VLISIITITRNDASGLQRTATSVLSQTGAQVEWILVDGGSCNRSHQMAEDLKKDGHLQTVVRGTDRGPYDAMTKGAKLAQGGVICFLNSGDVFYGSGTLQRVTELLEQHRPEVLVGWGQLGHTIQGSWLSQLPAVRMASLGFCHQAAYYRKEAFAAVPFRNASQTDNDTHQLAALIERGYRVKIVPELLANRDTTPGLSAWGAVSTQSVLATLKDDYGLRADEAETILAFRRRAEDPATIRGLLERGLPRSCHPHTLSHLAILCLDTLSLRQAAKLSDKQQTELRSAAISALHSQIGALATEQLCEQLHQAVLRREMAANQLS